MPLPRRRASQDMHVLLAAKYVGSCACTSPSDFGLPVRRQRLYMWFDSMTCLDEEHADIDCYLLAARRSVRLTPRDYLKATNGERRAHYEDRVSLRPSCYRRAGSPPPRSLGPGPMPRPADYLAPGMYSRYCEHRDAAAKIRQSLSEQDCIVVDINQSASYSLWRPFTKPNEFPTIMKSSTLVVLSADEAHDCMFVPKELLSIHGIVLPDSVLRRLSGKQVRQLVGNSMHVVQIGTFTQCAFAARKWSGDQ